jgi:hypothetical protein
MADQPLPEEIDELIFSFLARHPRAEELWASGDTPIDIDVKELQVLVRAVNQGLRAALLRLADEVEQLKAER